VKKKAVVVGAGIAGLAGSIRLAVKGYEVHCFDANPYPGGKLTVFNLGNYRFDAGPSLFTMPQFVEELFLLAGKNQLNTSTTLNTRLLVIIFLKMARFSVFQVINKLFSMK